MNIFGSLTKQVSTIFAKQATAPANPAAGDVALYVKNDNNLYRKTSAGVESLVNSGVGGTNYIPNAGFEDGTTTGWISTVPGFSIVASSTLPLRGGFSGVFSTAGGTIGEEVYIPFAIDRVDRNSQVGITFNCEFGAGYVSGDIQVLVFDVTAATYSVVALVGNISGAFDGYFTASANTNYRLVFRDIVGTAFVLKVDNISVGPQAQVRAQSILADTTGYFQTIPGYLAQSITATGAQTIGTSTGFTIATINLPPGKYLVSLHGASIYGGGGSVTQLEWCMFFSTDNTTNPSIEEFWGQPSNSVGFARATGGVNAECRGHASFTRAVQVGSPGTNYYVRVATIVTGVGQIALKVDLSATIIG